ncbi:hypothetical protein [Vallitalea maricola]|uniref:Uncharacterized protein n=1 Tax=Vallitalea maricola TaxID=3074433 RepID=A0ACB5URJ7_9FIRM|nr:hypothetical protein AN2V17_45130 [Vallitalea sp. AN17-2]
MSYIKNNLVQFLVGIIITLGIIISTFIYVNYNRYEYHSTSNETIVFDKLTGKKYSPPTLKGNP